MTLILICCDFRFEEMRIRYERRDPRAEDVREIQELKSVIDAQDKDLRHLTEQLREMQMHRAYDKGNGICDQINYEQLDEEEMTPMQIPSAVLRKIKKPKINCDVIYEEENEG